MSGCMAFYHDTPVEFCKKVMDMDWSMEWTEDDLEEDETNPFDEISKEGKDFVKKLIAFDPKDRFTATEALNHSWLHVPVCSCYSNVRCIFSVVIVSTLPHADFGRNLNHREGAPHFS